MKTLSLVLLFVLVFTLGIHAFTSINQDIGRHLTLGKIIWETRSVPDTNLFSYTAPDFPFINHHWLGEVLLYAGSAVGGLEGLIIIKALVITAAFALAFFAAYRKEHTLTALGIGILSLGIMIERMDVRPEIFSFLFFGWYLFVLFRKPQGWWLWTLPLIQILWVNTHIYFFMGPLVYGLFMLGNLFQEEYRTTLSWRHPHIAAGILIGFAMLINPFGWEGALYPLKVFGNYGYSVMENQTPMFLKAFGYPQFTSVVLYGAVLIVLILLLVQWKSWRTRIFPMSLGIVTAVLALMMIRNFPLFALAMMPVAMQASPWRGGRELRVSWVVPLLLAALIYSAADNQLYTQWGLARTFGLHVPGSSQKAIDVFRTHNLRGPIFNNFDIGSYLIWKLPEQRVFIDGRPEAYPADFIQQVYIPMQTDEKMWEKYSQQYGIQTIFWSYHDVTPWSVRFLERISQDPEWRRIHQEGGIVIFTKND